jgi:hypothetical protein
MAAYQLTLVGLILDIVGVFLLAVEAIKLPNLQRLRDKVFIPLHHSVLPATLEAPRSVRKNRRWRHNPEWIVIEPHEQRSFVKMFKHFYLSHYLGGMLGTLLIVLILQMCGLNIWALFSTRDIAIFIAVHIVVALVNSYMLGLVAAMFPMTMIPFFIAAILMLYPPSLVFMAIGEVMHVGSIKTSRGIISFLNFIDRTTPDGTIGIIGFLFVLIGFILQFIGTWAGSVSSNP